jgi:hypothetical protein
MASSPDNLDHVEKDAGSIQVEKFDNTQESDRVLTQDEKKILK